MPGIPHILDAAGITFKNSDLLTLALTHASKNRDVNNQRLEFLGDRVLGLALAHALYDLYGDENEGALALRHAALVQAKTLATIARTHHLSDDIIVSASERAAQTTLVDNVLADTVEALIGALYLDQGFDACVRFVMFLWADTVKTMVIPPQDPKNTLQEWAQGRGLPLPIYTLTDRTGPDHAPVFNVAVHVEPDYRANGSGATRRAAEKQAATALLQTLKEYKQ